MAKVFLVSANLMGVLYVDKLLEAGDEIVGVAAGVANSVNAGINGRPVRQRVPGMDPGQDGAFGTTDDYRRASETEKTYMAAITLDVPEDAGFLPGSAFYLGIVDGLSNMGGTPTEGDITNLYAGATIPTPIEQVAALEALYQRHLDQQVEAVPG